MKISSKTVILAFLLGIGVAFSAFTNEAGAQNKRPRPQGPPPEAYTACEGLSAGDTAEFESPRGDIITGTCEEEGDRLVLRPDNPPGGGGRPSDDE